MLVYLDKEMSAGIIETKKIKKEENIQKFKRKRFQPRLNKLV